MRSEVKVGIFVFIGMLLLFFLTTQVGSFKNYSKEGYRIYANLENAAGLEKNSKVKANGIDVGYIDALKIDGNHIKATLFINQDVKIPVDSLLTPMQESMLGGKYAGITLGSAKEYLKKGEHIESAKALASINKASDSMSEAADEFKAFIVEFRQVFDINSRDNLRKTFANLEAITAELKEFSKLDRLNKTADNFNDMAVNLSHTGEKFSKTADIINGKLPQIMANLDNLVKDLKEASRGLKHKIPTLADKFTAIGDQLQSIIHENKKPLHATITSADTFFSTGEDAFAKVDALLDTIDKVQLEVAMRGEWMSQDSYSKGYLSLDYKPNDTKSYKFDIAGMEDYSRLSDSGVPIKPTLHEETNLLLSAQIAKRFDDITLRAGLIENTFGAGFDYYMLHDTLKTSAELFDVNAENDVRGENPHAKVSARYTLLKHFDLYGGVDNFLNSDASNLFLGLGVRFYDDDLKTLIMSQSLGSFAK
jgi:phospholipid/cholesterol/gamma-HCH transport system substrate-binding protein